MLSAYCFHCTPSFISFIFFQIISFISSPIISLVYFPRCIFFIVFYCRVLLMCFCVWVAHVVCMRVACQFLVCVLCGGRGKPSVYWLLIRHDNVMWNGANIWRMLSCDVSFAFLLPVLLSRGVFPPSATPHFASSSQSTRPSSKSSTFGKASLAFSLFVVQTRFYKVMGLVWFRSGALAFMCVFHV